FYDLNDIVLPWRYCPGIDMVSKLVLQEPPTVDIIVEYLIGSGAKEKYKANPSEWINGSGSDVLVICEENDSTMPPVLIEVQHAVDDIFVRRLLGYCLSLEKQYDVLRKSLEQPYFLIINKRIF
ncbi:hypothetical protein INT47_007832, partial [Mucor saturninus]